MAAEGMKSVTLVKESPDQKVGVELKEKRGAVYIKKISKSGLFANSELGADDKVLSINGKRMEKNQTLEEYKEMTLDNENIEKITIVVRKAGAESTSKSPNPRKKVFRKEVKLNADGTPILGGAFDATGEEDKVQVVCKATKPEKGSDDVGLAFVKVGEKLFVSGIASDSIFHPDQFDEKDPEELAQLEFGDRIASVNDTNFMSYADANYASALLQKHSVRECVLYVEKGWNVLGPGHVDPIHFDPSLARGGKDRYKKKTAPAAGDDDSASSEEPANKVKKPNLKDVAPPPKDDDDEEEEKMWWDM